MKKIKVQNDNILCTKHGYISAKTCLNCENCFGIDTFGGQRKFILCKLGSFKDSIIKKE
jgi:hypothetical protein